jgi:hypothetical protein
MAATERLKIEHLAEQQIKVLKAIKKEGEKHLKYFYETMKYFTYPERRLKCFDTNYYEEALPRIEEILRQRGVKF